MATYTDPKPAIQALASAVAARFARFDRAQTLTAGQQAQVRTNIGAGTGTVTAVKVNGTTSTPVAGVVDLGTISGGGTSSISYDTDGVPYVTV